MYFFAGWLRYTLHDYPSISCFLCTFFNHERQERIGPRKSWRGQAATGNKNPQKRRMKEGPRKARKKTPDFFSVISAPSVDGFLPVLPVFHGPSLILRFCGLPFPVTLWRRQAVCGSPWRIFFSLLFPGSVIGWLSTERAHRSDISPSWMRMRPSVLSTFGRTGGGVAFRERHGILGSSLYAVMVNHRRMPRNPIPYNQCRETGEALPRTFFD
uniref:Uncharacterized protein n=1 Tax=Candidatus Kentrum sp. MB TaxID=2138164 RepID=A0A451BD73_9GAMM|nr:MAG: hypothetical protein BECKMB1821I_GA0114274_104612 [Candidatus Kentron sp. MB]VFK76231.1 MAG: hypothetical protein BECKMB1821H_GA0114242_104712 [Candidatus Kentron sp. MB]